MDNTLSNIQNHKHNDNAYVQQTLKKHYAFFNKNFLSDNSSDELSINLFDGIMKLDVRRLNNEGSEIDLECLQSCSKDEYRFFAFIDMCNVNFGDIHIIEKSAICKYVNEKQIQLKNNNYLIERDFVINYNDKILAEAGYNDKELFTQLSGVTYEMYKDVSTLF